MLRRLLILVLTLGAGAFAAALLQAERERRRERDRAMAEEFARPETRTPKTAPSTGGPPEPAPEALAEVDGRCRATTGSGKRCRREAEPASRFCWQHG